MSTCLVYVYTRHEVMSGSVCASPVLLFHFRKTVCRTGHNQTNEPDLSEPSAPLYFIANRVDTGKMQLDPFTVVSYCSLCDIKKVRHAIWSLLPGQSTRVTMPRT